MKTRLVPSTQPRPIAFDARDDGVDYRVCPDCIRGLRFADSIADPVYEIRKGEIEFCEECDASLEP